MILRPRSSTTCVKGLNLSQSGADDPDGRVINFGAFSMASAAPNYETGCLSTSLEKSIVTKMSYALRMSQLV